MPELLVDGKWIPYKGTTSTRKLYVRAKEAASSCQKWFYCYDYTGKYRVSRTVQGIALTRAERDALPYVSINGVPKSKLPLVIVLDTKMKEKTTPANPKQLYGDKKPDLRLLPLSGQLAQWAAHKDGANKYGPFNWRDNPVEADTYINAAKRHLELWAAGEELARDTGVNNLGAVMACCAILLDAQLHDTLIDNRHKSKAECNLLHDAESMVKKLREAQQVRDLEKEAAGHSIDHRWTYLKFGELVPDLTGYSAIWVMYYDDTTERVTVDWNKHQHGISWYAVKAWRK